MKEASGELSMTAIAVVAIAAIGVLFGTVIYPNIQRSLEHNQMCSASYGCTCSGATCNCNEINSSGTEVSITCDNPESN